MATNSNNNNDNNNDIKTSPEEQKRLESDAVAKESVAQRKSTEKFSEITNKLLSSGAVDATGDDLKHTVRLLVMAEQTDALTAVLTRLNGDRESWEVAQREPVALIAMIIEEQQKRMAQLQEQLKQKEATTQQ